MGTLIVLAIVALLLGLAIRSTVKSLKSGGCAGCSGCSSSEIKVPCVRYIEADADTSEKQSHN